jgi:hypothetical protein
MTRKNSVSLILIAVLVLAVLFALPGLSASSSGASLGANRSLVLFAGNDPVPTPTPSGSGVSGGGNGG